MKTGTLALILATVWITIACDSEKNEYKVELSDSLREVIVKYVNENNIDVRSKIVTTDWVTSTFRTDIFISNTFQKLNSNTLPTYYSVVNDSIVTLIYSGVEKNIIQNRRDISDEINSLIYRNHIKLRQSDGTFYHEPRWLYSFCETDCKLIKQSSPFELPYIPCNYVLMQDTLGDADYVVTRRKK